MDPPSPQGRRLTLAGKIRTMTCFKSEVGVSGSYGDPSPTIPSAVR